MVSLDFELHWGIRDHTSVPSARDRLLGAREAIPQLLSLFAERGIHATWATVGMLMARDKRELLELLPERRPRYADSTLSPYTALAEVGESEADDPFHYAPSLVERIVATPGQELATHTFSHFYCLERGQDELDFVADLAAARRAAARFGVEPRSIVFPRNQVNPAYLPALRDAGIRSYRNSPPAWFYAPVAGSGENLGSRAARLVDTYLPLARATAPRPTPVNGPTPVRAGAFLRPYTPRLRAAEPLRLARLGRAMEDAARSGGVFHLWWHPHNFGRHTAENLSFLTRVLDRFRALRQQWGMESATMLEAAGAAP